MKKRWGFFGFFFFFLLGAVAALLLGHQKKGEIAVVEILGGIYDAKSIVEQLDNLQKEDSVRAVVLRIDSPGGSVGASQEIYETVKDFRQTKPVVASLGTVAASGGYYVAAAANKIIANEGTITGSIGVRMEFVNVEELLQWARLKPSTLKSGKLKDMGSPTRPMTDEERTFLEGILKVLHGQFKKAVAENRGLSLETVDEIADGRILTGLEAMQAKLVDELGNLRRAVRVAGNLAGIKGEPEFFYSRNPEREMWDYLPDILAEGLGRALTRFVWNGGTFRFSY